MNFQITPIDLMKARSSNPGFYFFLQAGFDKAVKREGLGLILIRHLIQSSE
ncbi:hypothetical protein SAMN05720606_103141 [Paenibacillus polysaccharolyticus]|uniref:Uncharacterized protein n=1 Tax=Paenibacillus polysaccharolyticus TaxID=582692 RepID=A0A1G5E3T1_9BACL|nr:hypothetical protein [Paenibacillus polysaccharolyticus]SCY21537.1 hypothetical protein SAMN05720606_103141 [Paenibacillus polysaccharolyticus]